LITTQLALVRHTRPEIQGAWPLPRRQLDCELRQPPDDESSRDGQRPGVRA
jgi:hypothetical protein